MNSYGITPEEIGLRLTQLTFNQTRTIDGPRVAITGSWHCTDYGRAMAQTLARDLTWRGIRIVAPVGPGIGGAALRAALTAQKKTGSDLQPGTPLGIVAHRLDRDGYFPAADLHRDVIAEARAVSIAPWSDRPTGRLRALAGGVLAHLADAVIIVEASPTTSHQLTITETQRLGKPLFAVPGQVGAPQAMVPNQLIRDGAAELITDASQIPYEAAGWFDEDRHCHPATP